MSSITKQNTKAKIAELADGLSSLESKLREISKDLRKFAGRKRNTTSSSTESEEPKPKSRSAWQDWNSECTKRFAEDYAAHLADVGKKSDAITFASKCRSSTHVGEWEEYLATWNAAHPKVEKPKKSGKSKVATAAVPAVVDMSGCTITISNSATSSLPTASPPPAAKSKKSKAKPADSSDSEGEAPAKKKPATKPATKPVTKPAATSDSEDASTAKKSKVKSSPDSDSESAKKTRVVKNAAIDSSDDEGSVKKAKKSTKEEKAAAKAAAVAAAAAAAIAQPPTPWTWRNKNYLKNESNQVWQASPEGEVGDWVGIFEGKTLKKSDGPL